MPETTIDYINSNPPPPSFYGEVYTDYKKKMELCINLEILHKVQSTWKHLQISQTLKAQ